MKKFFSLFVTLAGLMMATSSCSDDDFLIGSKDGDTSVTFNLEIPRDGLNTLSRADGDELLQFGTGERALYLTYAVYEQRSDGSLMLVDVKEHQGIISNYHASISLSLVKGKTYSFAFWAESAANASKHYYTFNAETQNIEIDYEGVSQNDEDRDAFFTSVRDFKVTESATYNDIVLRRPFAQIDFGARDLHEPFVEKQIPNLQTRLTTRAATKLNLITGEVSDEQEVTFDAASPCEEYEFPHKDPNNQWEKYYFLSMDYLLVADLTGNGTEQKLVDITYEVLNGDEHVNTLDITNVPVRRNYQTCIFGRLLTGTTDFEITIDPAFNQPHYDVTFLEFRELREKLSRGETVTLDSDIYFGRYSTSANDNGGTDCIDVRDDVLLIPVGVEATLILNNHRIYNAAFEVLGKLNIMGDGEVRSWAHNEYGNYQYRPLFQTRKSNYQDNTGVINIMGGHYYCGTFTDGTPLPAIYDGADHSGVVNIYGGTFEGEYKDGRWQELCYHDGGVTTDVNIYGGTFIGTDPRNSHQNDVTFTNAGTTTDGRFIFIARPTDMAKIISAGGEVTFNEEGVDVLDLSLGVNRTAPLTVTLGKNVKKVIVGDFAAQTTLVVADGYQIDNEGLVISGNTLSNFALTGDGGNVFPGIGWSIDWSGKTINNVTFQNVKNLPAINYVGGSVSGLQYLQTKGWAENCPMIAMKNMKRADNIVIDCPDWNGHRDVNGDKSSYLYLLDDLTGDVTIRCLNLFNYCGGAVFIRTAGKATVENVNIYYGEGCLGDALHIDGSKGMTSCTVRNCSLTTNQNGNRLYIYNAQDNCVINVIGNTIDTSNPGIATNPANQAYGIRIDRADGTPVKCKEWHIYGNKWYGWEGWDYRSKIEVSGFPMSGSPEDLSYAYRENE